METVKSFNSEGSTIIYPLQFCLDEDSINLYDLTNNLYSETELYQSPITGTIEFSPSIGSWREVEDIINN